jgi:hypothetical protein
MPGRFIAPQLTAPGPVRRVGLTDLATRPIGLPDAWLLDSAFSRCGASIWSRSIDLLCRPFYDLTRVDSDQWGFGSENVRHRSPKSL